MKRHAAVLVVVRQLCKLICVCVILFAALQSGKIYASEKTEKVRVGYYENEVFEEGAAEGLVKNGYAYEYYRKISEYTGWKYDYVYGSFSELYDMLLNGKIDLLAGLAWKEDRSEIIGYPESAMGSEIFSLVKHESDSGINADVSSLNGKKIGVLESAISEKLRQYLSDHNVNAAVVTYDDYSILFSAFDSNEVDILAAEGDGAYGRDDAEVLFPFGESEYYLCVNAKRPDLLNELNIAQNLLAADEPNYLNSLRTKYYSASVSARAFSDVEKEWLETHDSITVGYLENFLPYSDTDENGQVTGLVKDIIPEIISNINISIKNINYKGFHSYDDMIAAIGSNDVDIAFPVGGGLYYSEENGIYQSNPLVSASSELVYKGDFNEHTTNRFAVNENNRMQIYYVRTNYPDAVITQYKSIDDCLLAVLSEDATCTVLNGLRANDLLKNRKYKDLSYRRTSRNDDICFGVEIGNEGLLKLLNRGINVIGSDYAQNLSYRYTSGLYSYGLEDFITDHPVLLGVIVFLIALVIILLLVRSSRNTKKELKKQLELREQLIEETENREQQGKMITALTSNYHGVYYVDLDKDVCVCYRNDPRLEEAPAYGATFPYLRDFTRFAHSRVAEAYREGFLDFIRPENIRNSLQDEMIISYRFLELLDGKETYAEIRMAGVRHPEDRVDHKVHAVGVGFSDIDAEMRNTMAQQEALSEALAAAEEANKAKTAFLSNMSHEIRTPMNAIIGLDSLALRNKELTPETMEYLEKIGASAKHLLGLINDILDMSRIESGRIAIRHEEFSFSVMLEQINTMVMSQCSEKGLKYTCSVLGGISDYYIGDDMKLKQVLINILSNAIKFTDAPGSVDLVIERKAVFEDQTTLRFSVKDTGIGISKEFLPRIFDSFTQEDGDRNNKYGSTGLGMAITRSIVQLMNGTISVESEKGVGTEFTVILSLKNCEDQGPKISYIKPNDLQILVVDDEEIAAEHARLILDEVGINADIALSGDEALNMLEIAHVKQKPYNLVLLDWKMPKMDGLDVAKQIRQRYDKETTIIILTSFNWDEIMDEALHIGVDSFLAKPLFASNVIDEFERIARKNNMIIYKERNNADLNGKRILVAEDVLINAEIMRELLSVKGAVIDHAENGRIALEMFENSRSGYYSAILMDIRMPEMDGLEAAKAIRDLKRDDASKIPIIAMTANAFDEDVQRSLQVGMNAHLSKPVEPETLYRTLEELIREDDVDANRNTGE